MHPSLAELVSLWHSCLPRSSKRARCFCVTFGLSNSFQRLTCGAIFSRRSDTLVSLSTLFRALRCWCFSLHYCMSSMFKLSMPDERTCYIKCCDKTPVNRSVLEESISKCHEHRCICRRPAVQHLQVWDGVKIHILVELVVKLDKEKKSVVFSCAKNRLLY